jgi:large subunit ribosomal protein L13
MTEPTKAKDIKRTWHMIDLKDQTLGRVSTDIAHKLMGKSKAYFVRNLDCGDYVVAINAKFVKTTGNKETKKMYYRHSGYPGGFKAEALKDLRARRPEMVIEHAVKGMLPQNRLRASMMKRLHVFPEAEHRFSDKLKVKAE